MDVKKLKEDLTKLEENKDWIIENGIKFNRITKQLIYSVIREDWKNADKYVEELEKKYRELKSFVKDNPKFLNNFSINEQEYVEAKLLYEFIKNGKLLKYEDLNVDPYNYVSGLADFCGELLRKSVEEMIKGNLEFALKAKNIIEEIYLGLLEVELKNYELRRKLDFIANILNKLTEYIFIKKK